MMMRRPCPSGSRLLKPFFKFKKFVYNGKMTRDNFLNLKKGWKPGARRTRAWHHHGSVTPTSARAILHHTDHTYLHHFAPECMHCNQNEIIILWGKNVKFFLMKCWLRIKFTKFTTIFKKWQFFQWNIDLESNSQRFWYMFFLVKLQFLDSVNWRIIINKSKAKEFVLFLKKIKD